MNLSAEVTMDGEEPITIKTRPIDFIKWEQGGKHKLSDGMGFTDMMRLIHSAARREGLTEASFEDWAARVADFQPTADVQDPTLQDQSTD